MVHFVGAGSGAVDLITLRGKRLLEEADVVVYAGSLVNKELLAYTSKRCACYDSARMCLEEVMKIMTEACRKGKNVVRLHTGDSSIYGAVREQMDWLERENIPYDVCPGVSSFCGAAASLKTELTLPEVAQSVIITRMEGRTPVPDGQKLKDLAKHQTTMVIFLSAGMTRQVKEALIEGGYAKTTPCAVVYKATWPEEKIVRGILDELPEMAERENITKTALIIVGNVLGNDYALSKLYDKTFSTGFRQAVGDETFVSERKDNNVAGECL